MSDSLWPHGLYSTRLLCPWDSPAKTTGVGCLPFPPQGDFPNLRIELKSLMSPALAGGLLNTGTTWEAQKLLTIGTMYQRSLGFSHLASLKLYTHWIAPNHPPPPNTWQPPFYSLDIGAHWGADRHCIESVGHCGWYRYFNNIKSLNLWIQDVFPFTCVFSHFFHKCFVVFNVSIFDFFG